MSHETLTYYEFPTNHWRQLRTNNALERIIREIRRRTRVVGAFPDGHSALMLVAARLRHIASTRWGKRRLWSAKTQSRAGRRGGVFVMQSAEDRIGTDCIGSRRRIDRRIQYLRTTGVFCTRRPKLPTEASSSAEKMLSRSWIR